MSYLTMLGVHPRLNQLLVTHLKELNAESLIYASGDVVIQEQQHADDILLLQSGELSVEIGAQRELARIKPGELLGEMGLSGDNRHCATVRVHRGPAEIIRVNADTFQGIEALPTDTTADPSRLQEAWNDALKFKEDALAAFRLGYLSLKERSIAEQLTWACARALLDRLHDVAKLPDDLKTLPAVLAETYYANLSIFRSAPDTWAIQQLFPLMPLHRLNEQPTRLGHFADLTCDSDGKLNRFIDDGNNKPLLELHPLKPNEPYLIGMFLGGAYQEVMGNLHNLFGSTDAAHIRLAPGGDYQVDHVVRGDTNADVLEMMEHDPDQLLERLRMASEKAISSGQLRISEARRLMDHLESSLRQSTYLQG